MSESGGGQAWKQHLASGRTWWRLPFMILFGVLFSIVVWLVGIIALFQFLHTLFTGAPNRRVLGFSTSLGAYIEQMVEYLIYQTEQKPFPFADWPSARAPATRSTDTRTPDTRTPDARTPDARTPDARTPDARTAARTNPPVPLAADRPAPQNESRARDPSDHTDS